MNDLKKLIEDINNKRMIQGFKIIDLAKIGGCSSAILGDYFVGRRNPKSPATVSALHKIAKHLKIDVEKYDISVFEPEKTEVASVSTGIFKAKPKGNPLNFIHCGNGSIVCIDTGETFTNEQFNDKFEVIA